MDKKKIELIAAIVAVIIFVIFLARATIKTSAARSKISKSLGKNIETTAQEAPKENHTYLLQKNRAANLHWAKDPFVISGHVAPSDLSYINSPEQLMVTGIIFDKTNPKATFAIINDTVVKAGDKFGSLSIVDIKEDSVTITLSGKTYSLPLWQEQQ